MFTAEEILDIAVRLEKNGEKIYKDAARKINAPELVSLLEWMAAEEVQHVEWFIKMKASVSTASADPVVDEMGRELINDMLGDRSFSLDDVDFSQIESVNDMIATFIEFEKDTVLFYEMMETFIDAKEPRNTLKRIITEENCHIKQLRELLNARTIAAC